MDGESDEVNRATERVGCERRSVLAGYGAPAVGVASPARTLIGGAGANCTEGRRKAGPFRQYLVHLVQPPTFRAR